MSKEKTLFVVTGIGQDSLSEVSPYLGPSFKVTFMIKEERFMDKNFFNQS